jgi:GNAT superfamily N-acetyltransferase
MPASLDVVRLAESRVEAAGGVIARAFVEETVMKWVLPDSSTRLAKLETSMAAWCRYGQLFAAAYVTAEPVVGTAVWLPPDQPDSTPEREEVAGYGRIVERWSDDELRRLTLLGDTLGGLRLRIMASAHWYLWVIGVDPLWQGNGIGSALLQPVFEQADRFGHPCYLETHTERNVRFYQRHGFAVVGETDIPEDGPHFWLMARPAS